MYSYRYMLLLYWGEWPLDSKKGNMNYLQVNKIQNLHELVIYEKLYNINFNEDLNCFCYNL